MSKVHSSPHVASKIGGFEGGRVVGDSQHLILLSSFGTSQFNKMGGVGTIEWKHKTSAGHQLMENVWEHE